MKGYKNKMSGFTLVELLVAMAILAALLAIGAPLYTGYMSATKKSEAKTNIENLRLLMEQYYSENAKYCPDASCLNKYYEYKEDDNGTATTDTITSFLTSFKPKSASASTAVLYDYKIEIDSANQNNYTVTAFPVTLRGAPAGNLTIDQNGAKTGW